MALSCDIKFDHNPLGVFFPGQEVTGKVELNLIKPKKLKGVSLKIAGYAYCEWSEHMYVSNGTTQTQVTIVYSGRDDYLSTTTYLAGAKGGNEIELPQGTHLYNFACTLPSILPSSFEGTYGRIRYTVRVILERPWKFDQTYKVGFTVLKELNLNWDAPILGMPTQMETIKNFWCGPCSSRPLTIVARIPQSGYVPGQKIIVNAEVKNMSNKSVERIKFMLRKIIDYNSKTPSKKTKQEIVVIQERRTGGVKKKQQENFQIILSIPPEPPTDTDVCTVINISYEVRIKAKVTGLNMSPTVSIPVTIGTIPLNQNASDLMRPAAITNGQYITNATVVHVGQSSYSAGASSSSSTVNVTNMIQPIIAPIHKGQLANQQDIPPPSYEESLVGGKRIEEDEDEHPIGEKPYTPRYPVYYFNDDNFRQLLENSTQSDESFNNYYPQKNEKK